MKKHSSRPARLADQFVRMSEKQHIVNNTQTVVEMLILCNNAHVAEHAAKVLQRDLGSQLIHLRQDTQVVGAKLRPLSGFLPSECLYYYHYHMQRALGSDAQVWLATSVYPYACQKGGRP